MKDAKDLHQGNSTTPEVLYVPKQKEASKQYCFSKKPAQGQPRDCYRCGGKNHKAFNCRFKDAVCHNCKKQGHLVKVCRSKPDDKRTHRLEEDVKETQFVGMYNVEGSDSKPYIVSLSLNDAPLKMEVDTGATRTIMSEKTYRILWKGKKRPELSPTKVRLRTCSGQ